MSNSVLVAVRVKRLAALQQQIRSSAFCSRVNVYAKVKISCRLKRVKCVIDQGER